MAHMDLEDVPFLSPVLGEGAEAHRLLRVGGWTLTLRGDDEPLIADEDLGRRLGYDRPRKIRELIERHANDKNINPFEVRPTVGQTGGRPGRCFLLSEADALFVVAHSETPKAVALTREMIRVYILARRGLLTQQGEAPMAALRAEVSRLAALVDDLRARPQVTAPPAAPPVTQPDYRTRLVEALTAAHWSVRQAALALGMPRRTLYRHVLRAGLTDTVRRMRGHAPIRRPSTA